MEWSALHWAKPLQEVQFDPIKRLYGVTCRLTDLALWESSYGSGLERGCVSWDHFSKHTQDLWLIIDSVFLFGWYIWGGIFILTAPRMPEPEHTSHNLHIILHLCADLLWAIMHERCNQFEVERHPCQKLLLPYWCCNHISHGAYWCCITLVLPWLSVF